jgi:hypothetical protein
MASNLVKHKNAAERLAALARSASNIAVLKFVSGNWSIGDTPVLPDTKFVVFPDQVAHAWTCFRDNKAVDEIAAIVIDDEDGDPAEHVVKGRGRGDLGDNDEAQWPTDKAGKRMDPWSYGFSLPMMNVGSGAMVVFRSASVGGRGVIAEQVGSFQRNPQLGYPIVTLASGSYKNKKFGGFTIVPVLRMVGYDAPKASGVASGEGARVVGTSKVGDRDIDDMDDDIPF